MGIKIKHTDPTLNSFSTDDLVVNVSEGSLFFKSNTELFRIKGDTLTTTVTESFGDELWHRTGNNLYYTSGSVGIGTTAPSKKLTVSGSISASGDLLLDNNQFIKFKLAGTDTEVTTFGYDSGNLTRVGANAEIQLGGDIRFNTVISTNVSSSGNLIISEITASGNISSSGTGSFSKVGIGTTSPAYTLDLGENSSTIRLVSENNGTAIRIGAGGSSNDVTLIRVDGNSSNHDGESDNSQFGFSLKYMGSRGSNLNSLSIFSDAEEGTAVEALTVLQDGKVGIGTTSPTSKLHLASDTADVTLTLEADISNDTESHNPSIKFLQDGGHAAGWLGFTGANSQWPDSTTLTGGSQNALILGLSGSATGIHEQLQFATQNNVRATFRNDGVFYLNKGLSVADKLDTLGSTDYSAGSNRGVVTYFNTATSGSLQNDSTGAIVISDIANENIFYHIKLKGYVYHGGKGAFEITLGGYWYPEEHAGAGLQRWIATNAYVNGTTCPYQKIRFGYLTSDVTKPVIIIGETNTTGNNYSQIGIEVMQGYAHTRTAPTWTITQKVTDISAYTVQKTRQFPVFIDGTNVAANASGNASGQDEGTFNVRGAIAKGSGTFKIDHPDPLKTDTHYLQHGFVESPTGGDNIYRWNINTVNKMHTIKLPDYYKFLNKDDMIWISPVNHFGRAYGTVNQEQTEISITADTDGIYNVLLVGTRKDPTILRHFKGVEIKK